MALNHQNRIIEANRQPEYNKDIKDERSNDYERDNIHDGRGLQSSEPDSARTAGGHSGQMVADEENLSEGTPQGSVLQSPDERDTGQSSVGSPAEGDRTGGNAYQTDGTARGTDGEDESGRYDELDSLDEQHQELGTGNRESTGNIRLSITTEATRIRVCRFSAGMILSERYSVLHRIYRLLLKILKTSMREIPIAIPVPNTSRVSSITTIPNSH